MSVANSTRDAADPVLAALQRIEQRLAALETATAAVGSATTTALPMFGVAVDTLDEVTAHLAERGIDVDARMRAMLRLTERLTAPEIMGGVDALLQSGMLAPPTVAALGHVAQALARTESPTPMGPWKAFRALGDPDVQRALGYLVAVAKDVGRALDPDARASVARQLEAAK